MKIEVISTLWSVLLIAMLAGTVTLYDSQKTTAQMSQQEITLSAQQPGEMGLR